MVRLAGLSDGRTDPGTDTHTQPATVATLKPADATQQRDKAWRYVQQSTALSSTRPPSANEDKPSKKGRQLLAWTQSRARQQGKQETELQETHEVNFECWQWHKVAGSRPLAPAHWPMAPNVGPPLQGGPQLNILLTNQCLCSHPVKPHFFFFSSSFFCPRFEFQGTASIDVGFHPRLVTTSQPPTCRLVGRSRMSFCPS